MKRVVSMLPAATEIVAALGRVDWLVAVSHDCSYPPEVRGLPWVTRCTFDAEGLSSAEIDRIVRERMRRGEPLFVVDREVLRAARPDVIITQKLCDVCAVSPDEVQRALRDVALEATVLELGPQSLADVLQDVLAVGHAIGEDERARQLHQQLVQRLDDVRRRSEKLENRPDVVVLEWLDPPYCCGHWIPELVEIAGGQERLGVRDGDSHPITWDDVKEMDPDVLIIACCGYSKERSYRDATRPDVLKHLRALTAYRCRRVWICDGTGLFTCPGPRLVDTCELIYELLSYTPERPLPEHAMLLHPDEIAVA